MRKKNSSRVLPGIKLRCQQCGSPLWFEFLAVGYIAGGTYREIGNDPYGRFSFVLHCHKCDTRQRLTIKYRGEEHYSAIGKACEALFNSLRRRVPT